MDSTLLKERSETSKRLRIWCSDIFGAMNANLLPTLTWILGIFFKQLPDELPKTESQWADIFLDVPEIIKKSGYPVEVHHVTTEDGYIVTLHRLPRRMSEKAPTLVQHGIFHSSADSIISGPNSGLGAYFIKPQQLKRGKVLNLLSAKNKIKQFGELRLCSECLVCHRVASFVFEESRQCTGSLGCVRGI
uniref:(California timema) hypothetical protein n=1 Tax=Timema californicum TaxID=61474 RepID=A0A7R9J306_TIMCA|nr:unnamed protein product [Timema californicum]